MYDNEYSNRVFLLKILINDYWLVFIHFDHCRYCIIFNWVYTYTRITWTTIIIIVYAVLNFNINAYTQRKHVHHFLFYSSTLFFQHSFSHNVYEREWTIVHETVLKSNGVIKKNHLSRAEVVRTRITTFNKRTTKFTLVISTISTNDD